MLLYAKNGKGRNRVLYIQYYYNNIICEDDDDDDDDEQKRSCRARSFCRVTSDMGIGRAEQVRRQTMFVHSVDCKG